MRLLGLFKGPRRKTRTTSRHRRLGIEALESKQMLSGISFSGGVVTVTGTESADTVQIYSQCPGKVVVNLNGYSQVFQYSTVTSFVGHLGGGDDSWVTYNPNIGQPMTVYGDAGNDTIVTGAGNDTVYGGSGINVVHCNGGNDLIICAGGNTAAYGGAGADTVDLRNGAGSFMDYCPAQGDVLLKDTPKCPTPNGVTWTQGTGTLVLDMAMSGVNVAFPTSSSVCLTWSGGSVTYSPVNYFVWNGTPGNDVMNATGFGGTLTINGLAGNDVLTGGSGPTTLVGGAGNDVLTAGPGVTTLDARDGVSGNDHLLNVKAVDSVLRDAGAPVGFQDSINPFTGESWYSGQTVQLSSASSTDPYSYSLKIDGSLRIPNPREATNVIHVSAASVSIDPALSAALTSHAWLIVTYGNDPAWG